jgi:flagellar biosynthetic protein FliQ
VDLGASLVEALHVSLWVAAPVLGACLALGVVTSVFQAASHSADPALGFVPKWFAVLAALWLSADFVRDRLIGFTSHLLQVMSQLGR